jgi:hypothetical protein
LRVPDDLRDAIEWVYGTVAEPIPPELHETSTRAEGREKAHSALALQNAIALFSGYDGGNPAWAADVETPTRLGEPTTRVRLCRRVGEEVEPWHATGDYAWERSEVSVARWRIASEDPAIEALLRAAKSTMRDEGRYCVSVPLVRGAEGWAGSALDDQGQVVNVAYGPWGLRMGVREH